MPVQQFWDNGEALPKEIVVTSKDVCQA